MKRKAVTRTFVRQECQRLRAAMKRKLAEEVENLAQIAERSFARLEKRIAKLEAKISEGKR